MLRVASDRVPRPGLERKAEPCGEAHRPHDAERVLVEARVRIADAADDAALDILHAAVEIHEAPLIVVGHRIDREIPAHQVVPQIRGERHLIRMAPVGVAAIDPVGRDLEAFVVQHDRHRAVPDPRVDGSSKAGLHLLRLRGRGDVPVLRGEGQHGISHTAANGIGFKPMPLQNVDDIFHFRRQFQTHQ